MKTMKDVHWKTCRDSGMTNEETEKDWELFQYEYGVDGNEVVYSDSDKRDREVAMKDETGRCH